MFVLAFSLGIAIVNQIGIFSHNADDNITEINTGGINDTLMDGITEVDGNITSDNEIADTLGGTAMLLQFLGLVRTMLTLAVLPYGYLVNVGVPAFIALPIQAIINATEIWGIIQFVTGRSTRTIE